MYCPDGTRDAALGMLAQGITGRRYVKGPGRRGEAAEEGAGGQTAEPLNEVERMVI